MIRMLAFFAALPWSTAALAQQEEAASPLEALVRAIYEGRPFNGLEGMPQLDEDEILEIDRLAGCLPTREQHAQALIPILDWNCATNPENSRTLAFYETREGIEDLLIQPLAANFQPTDLALTMVDLPSYRRITRDFLDAVRDGGDPTLSGLIPITPLQLELLEVAQGERNQQMSGSDQSGQVYVWPSAFSDIGLPLITDLRFDSAGRPVGLVISYGIRQ